MHLSVEKSTQFTSGARKDQRASKYIYAIAVSVASDDADTIPSKPFMEFSLPILVYIQVENEQ